MKICVVYLARGYGNWMWERFISSLDAYDAGAPYTLGVMCKGMGVPSTISRRAGIVDYINDFGICLRAYRTAAERWSRLGFTHFVFLNSHSVVTCGDWLHHLASAIHNDSIGIAGFTASAESFYSNNPGNNLGLNHLFFRPFPNYHIRTTGFILRAEHCRLLPRMAWGKRFGYMAESGRRGISARIQRMGLGMACVDCYGARWAPEQWAQRAPFRNEAQEFLAVEDRQTRVYAAASEKEKLSLNHITWHNYEKENW